MIENIDNGYHSDGPAVRVVGHYGDVVEFHYLAANWTKFDQEPVVAIDINRNGCSNTFHEVLPLALLESIVGQSKALVAKRKLDALRDAANDAQRDWDAADAAYDVAINALGEADQRVCDAQNALDKAIRDRDDAEADYATARNAYYTGASRLEDAEVALREATGL